MLIAEVYTTYCTATDMEEMQNRDRVRAQGCHAPGRDSPDMWECIKSLGGLLNLILYL